MKISRPILIALVWGLLIFGYVVFDRWPDAVDPVDPSQFTEEERRYTELVDTILFDAGYLDRMSERFPDSETLRDFTLGQRLTAVLYGRRPGASEVASHAANAQAFDAGRTAAETDALDEVAIAERYRQMVSRVDDELASLYAIVMR